MASDPRLVVGRVNSLWSTIVMALLTGLLFPGFGVVFILTAFAGEPSPWGLLVWTAFWASMPFAVRRMQREHRIVGTDLVSTSHRGVVTRPLAGVVDVAPLRWRLPGARVAFADGAAFRVAGRVTQPFLAEVLAHAPFAHDRLPPGNWLRPRRQLWFLLGFLFEATDKA